MMTAERLINKSTGGLCVFKNRKNHSPLNVSFFDMRRRRPGNGLIQTQADLAAQIKKQKHGEPGVLVKNQENFFFLEGRGFRVVWCHLYGTHGFWLIGYQT